MAMNVGSNNADHDDSLIVNPSCLEALEILRNHHLVSLKTASTEFSVVDQPGNGVLPDEKWTTNGGQLPTSTDSPNTTLQSSWNPDKITFEPGGGVVSLDFGGRRLHRRLPCDPGIFSNFAASLTTLSLAGTDVPLDNCLSILDALRHGERRSGRIILRNLFLGGNGLGSEGASALAASGVLNSLTKLDLRYNDIRGDGVIAICAALENDGDDDDDDDDDGGVRYLYLEGNGIGDEGCEALAKLLSSPKCRVEEVFLGQNRIGPAGARSLAASLRSNAAVTKMYLEGNSVGDEGAAAFCEMLEGRRGETKTEAGATTESPLKHLYLENNNIGKELSNRLGRALRSKSVIADISS